MASNTWKMVGISQMLLGYKDVADVSVALMSADVSLTVGAGQGANFADASITDPIEILIGSEEIDVTGRAADVLTITRGKRGTSAAAHSTGTGNIAYIHDVQLPFTSNFAITPQQQELTFQGDGDQEYVSLSLGLRGTIQADKWFTDIWEKILGITAVTANVPVDVTTRWYPDAGQYPALRLQAICHAIDDNSGNDVPVRITIPKAQTFPRPWHPGAVGTAAKQMFDLAWTAQRTKTTLAGATLPGTLPKRGVFFYVDMLNTPMP